MNASERIFQELRDSMNRIQTRLWRPNFNERERKRFAKGWRELAAAANSIADGLLENDDQKVFGSMVLFLFNDDVTKEFMQVAYNQLHKTRAEREDEADDMPSEESFAQFREFVETTHETVSATAEKPVDPPDTVVTRPTGEGYPGQDLEEQTLG